MKNGVSLAGAIFIALLASVRPIDCAAEVAQGMTAKFRLDHNRLILEAEIRKRGGEWKRARLWLDSGVAGLSLSRDLAERLGLRSSASAPDIEIRIGGGNLDLSALRETSVDATPWLFASAGADANVPTSVLRRYDLVIDYPASTITFAPLGSVRYGGRRIPAVVEKSTGVVQIDASIGGRPLSLAIDLGASYTFVDCNFMDAVAAGRPEWPSYVGPVGCANMWGYWPQRETEWKVYRLPSVTLGSGAAATEIAGLGLVSLPPSVLGGLGSWYSGKTASRVEGFLGPNAFKAFRLGIDYARSAVYLEKTGNFDDRDMDLVPVGLKMLPDGSWLVFDLAKKEGRSLATALRTGDIIISIDGKNVKGLSMGPVVDALRGTPGSEKAIVVLRNGEEKRVAEKVERLP